jgi:hypothetical protein
MIKNSKLAIIALVTAVAIASPALAQSARYTGQVYSSGGVRSDSQALSGGGNTGFNARARDYNAP